MNRIDVLNAHDEGPLPVFFYDIIDEMITIKILHPSRNNAIMTMTVFLRYIDDIMMWTHELVEQAIGFLIMDELELNHPEKIEEEEGLIMLPEIKGKEGRKHPIHHIMSALVTNSGIDDVLIEPHEYLEKMPFRDICERPKLPEQAML